jgi:hypothetical protein
MIAYSTTSHKGRTATAWWCLTAWIVSINLINTHMLCGETVGSSKITYWMVSRVSAATNAGLTTKHNITGRATRRTWYTQTAIRTKTLTCSIKAVWPFQTKIFVWCYEITEVERFIKRCHVLTTVFGSINCRKATWVRPGCAEEVVCYNDSDRICVSRITLMKKAVITFGCGRMATATGIAKMT